MKKLEKEIKVLDIDKIEIEKRLEKIGAKKQEECLQKIYVYDMPTIYGRFYDCLLQLKISKKEYELEVCRNKLQTVLYEIDDLLSTKSKDELEKFTSMRSFVNLLNNTDNSKLFEVFSEDRIINIIKQFGYNPNKWVRLRETNGKTTITVKHILNTEDKENNNSKIQKVIETEINVPSLEEANNLLEQLGFFYRNYQEKYRVTYSVDGVEVDIDSWPLIPTYLEIENDSEKIIQDTIEKLGLKDKEIVSCNTDDIYVKYGVDLYKYRELRFQKK